MNSGSPDALCTYAANANSSSMWAQSCAAMWYCPSNTPQNTVAETNGATLWDFGNPNYPAPDATSFTRVVGYPWFGQRNLAHENLGTTMPTNVVPITGSGIVLPVPLQLWTVMNGNPQPQDSVLGGDAIITSTATPSLQTDYTDVAGGFTAMHHTTSHMNGKVPAGGVQLFLDGHALWINWKGTKAAECGHRQCG